MKQTKAAFRNKPFISLKGSILFLILIPMSGLIHAQYSMGTTGQLTLWQGGQGTDSAAGAAFLRAVADAPADRG